MFLVVVPVRSGTAAGRNGTAVLFTAGRGPRRRLRSHIGGVSPGTSEGAVRARMPSPVIASASGTSTAAFAGRTFWARTRTAITDIQVALMTPSTTSISISPMLEPTQQSPNSNPERTLSRRELVDAGRDHDRGGGGRPVRPVHRVHRGAHECPDGKVAPDEQRHGAHPTAGLNASHYGRNHARQHHRRHHRHPHGDEERERTEPGRYAHVHPGHLPDRDDPGCGGEPQRRRQRGCGRGCPIARGTGARSRHRAHRVPPRAYDVTASASATAAYCSAMAAYWRSSALAAPLRQLSAMDSDMGSGKMSSSSFSTPSKTAPATDSAEAFGMSLPRDTSASTMPLRTARTH